MLKTFSKGGVHPPENKLSAGQSVQILPPPVVATILLAQHIGVPAVAKVAVGDKVKVGQIIAESAGFVSANIHAPVSGTVKKIDAFADTSGYKRPAIQIETEGDEWLEGIDTSDELKTEVTESAEEMIRKITVAGIVGLGGATFPAHVKLAVPQGKKAEILVVNGVECEPYLTCDHRLMLEKGAEIIVGIRILKKALGVNKAVVGIENNKPDAIAHLRKCAAVDPEIEICPLKVKYPQGGEKQLIKAVTGREVPSGGLPVDVGAVPFNVATVFAVYEAVLKNKPVVERLVTVTGKGLANPSNFKVRIGTPINYLIEAAGGMPETTGKVISGGPMMGKALGVTDIPTTKGCSGILLMDEREATRKPLRSCTRCSKCVADCPMGLEPYLLMLAVERQMYDRAETEHIQDCIECGSCSYICPCQRPLLDYIRLGKSEVLKNIRARAKMNS
ncbi:MAG: electron transport complex subunit RsxC [Bacteroidales bacterium]|nr:electron transport complex subunit RsxC [Bacteroidales bacterium]